MRRFCFRAGIFLITSAALSFAQETQAQETAALDAVTRWKIINTLLFVAGLGWLVWKYAPAFFNARSADIQKAIQDATGLKIEAEFRYSEIDRKMAGLVDEVKKLRAESAVEMQREHQRFRQQTQAELEHTQRNVAAEVEAFRLEGVQQIRQHTAQLALQLAERQLQERFRSGEPADLLQDFIRLVDRGKN